MEEAARLENDVGPGGSARKVLCFLLGTNAYALHLSDLEAVLAPPPMARVPFTPPHVTGMASVRGEVVPVLDLRKVFTLQALPPGERARVLVVGGVADRVGLLVDEVAEVIRYEEDEILPPPDDGSAESGYLSGQLEGDSGTIGLIDLSLLLRGLRKNVA
jgi:purine-binding chemotaxis protein CheW